MAMRSATFWSSWVTPASYRERLLMLGAVAATTPLIIIYGLPFARDWSALAALGAAFALLLVLGRALRTLSKAETILAEGAKRLETDAQKPAPAVPDLLADAIAITNKLDALSLKAKRHPLTDLPRRDEFAAEVAQGVAGDGAKLMGVIRLANYVQIAAFDTAAADRILLAFAKRFEAAVDKHRLVAHVDRDCFAIWFRGAADSDKAAAELQALSYVLTQTLAVDGLTITPDIQIGSALYPIDADEPATLLTRAFVSLARPQRTVSGSIAFFAGRSSADAQRRFFLEQELRHAIARSQLSLHYQPLVDVSVGRAVGAEALLRWRHPQLGDVTPSEFVPILEESGLIHEIGLWALNTACRQARAWQDGGLTDIKLAVNLSALQLRDPSLKTVLQGTLARHELGAIDLELELTETAAMEDAERTLALFQELHEKGFGLAIDDFGSGYSSLGYLKRLPFNKLKIDREFVSHCDTRSDSRAICKALIELAHGLNIKVLAEGVERREEVEELNRLGCSIFQGYFFSHALPADQFAETVRRPEWLELVSSPVRRERAEIERRLAR